MVKNRNNNKQFKKHDNNMKNKVYKPELTIEMGKSFIVESEKKKQKVLINNDSLNSMLYIFYHINEIIMFKK